MDAPGEQNAAWRPAADMPFKTNAIAPGRAHLVDAAALWTPPVGRANKKTR
jgi:hypothetical protein